jgi:hypothetical protein
MQIQTLGCMRRFSDCLIINFPKKSDLLSLTCILESSSKPTHTKHYTTHTHRHTHTHDHTHTHRDTQTQTQTQTQKQTQTHIHAYTTSKPPHMPHATLDSLERVGTTFCIICRREHILYAVKKDGKKEKPKKKRLLGSRHRIHYHTRA